MKHITPTLLCAAIVTACITTAHAQTVVGLHLGTSHQRAGMNDTNPGVYVQLPSGLTAGTYYNSLRAQSYYAGYTWQQDGGPWAVSALAVTGYSKPVVPALIPSVRLGLTERAALRISLVLPPDSGGAVHFSLEAKL